VMAECLTLKIKMVCFYRSKAQGFSPYALHHAPCALRYA
jgi:hypothetical protein